MKTIRVVKTAALVAALAVVAGCSDKAPDRAEAGPASALAQQPTGTLRTRTSEAMAAQRYFTPAGNNAAELLLELRERGQASASDETALVELQPYLLIAVERAVERRELVEAQRLLDLLTRIDRNAPSIPRLATSIASLGDVLANDAAAQVAATEPDPVPTVAAARTPQATPPAAIAAASAPTAVAASAPSPSPATQAPAREAPPPASVEAQTDTPIASTNETVAAPAARVAPAIRMLRDEPPRYPPSARSRRLEGRVELAFTVMPDGSVGDIRVVQAEPAGVFNRAAIDAARRWRFAPMASAAASTRTLVFSPPQG